MRRCPLVVTAILPLVLTACGGDRAPDTPEASDTPTAPASTVSPPATPTTPTPTALKTGPDGRPFTVTPLASFGTPWAMAFLPGTPYAAITEKAGTLTLLDPEAPDDRIEVQGVPEVVVDDQGGMADVMPAPTFAEDQMLYLSWVEAGPGGTGGVVGRARLVIDGDQARLDGLERIWEQQPKVAGGKQFALRMAFSPDGKYLFVTSGERFLNTPAQDLSNTLGTIVRLTPDGDPAPGNPFADQGSPTDEIWSYGHRNPLGIAFAPDGTLWSTEMGPKGGDELNVITPGANYGWPEASNGSNYDGTDIPDHRPGDGFAPPKVFWNPSISPGNLMIYRDGAPFAPWQGDALIGGLSGQTLIHVDLDGDTARIADQWDMGQRIREVEEGPDGEIYLLEDKARLLRLDPVVA